MVIQNLLLIDDDNSCNSLVKFVLEQDTDWQILTTTDGQEGIAKAQLEQPDIILLDIMMPNVNGLDVYKTLKSDSYTSNIPIIFITAMTPIAPILQSQITEEVDVIIKPFDVIELADLIIESSNRHDSSVR